MNSQSSDDPARPILTSQEAETIEWSKTAIAKPATNHEPLTPGGWLAWFAILFVTLGMFTLTAISQSMLANESSGEASTADLMPIEMQGKLLVGQRNLQNMVPTPTNNVANKNDDPDLSDGDAADSGPSSAIQLPKQMDIGPYEQRLCYALLLNELESVDKAREHLELTDKRAQAAELVLSDQQKQLRETVGTLLQDYAAGDHDAANVGPVSRSLLRKRLGWIGELALVPAGTSNQQNRQKVLGEATMAMFVMMGGMLLGILMMIGGVVIVIVFLILMFNGSLRSHFQNQRGRHNLYAETFAIWMVVFFGLQLVIPLLLNALKLDNPLIQLGVMPPLFFGSLLVLVWPVLRGLSFAEVCRDIGWKFGNPFVEGSLGGIAYLAILPALFIALMLVVVMMSVLGPAQTADVFTKGSGPSHPIQEYLADGGLLLAGLVVLTASITAPIVEETMFRGVLYRHLRDWTASQSRFLSVGLSSVLNSLIFASIHPQGVLGIPLLMTLAIGFSLAREWRSSLFGPMIMHGMNNLIVTLFLFFLL